MKEALQIRKIQSTLYANGKCGRKTVRLRFTAIIRAKFHFFFARWKSSHVESEKKEQTHFHDAIVNFRHKFRHELLRSLEAKTKWRCQRFTMRPLQSLFFSLSR